MRMDDVGAVRRLPGGADEGEQEGRQQQRLPRLRAEVVHNSVPVRDPEVPERGRRDDLDLVTRRAKVGDDVFDETPRDVTRRAGVRAS